MFGILFIPYTFTYAITQTTPKNNKIMTASELKIGDTFKRDGFLLTVANITPSTYKNGTPCIMVECTTNGGKIVDSFACFKLTTKVK